MGCIESDHLPTVAGGGFDETSEAYYRPQIQSKTNTEVINIEEGFQYALYPAWSLLARLANGSYALVRSVNLSPAGRPPNIIEKVSFPLSREQGLQELFHEMEIQEDLSRADEIEKLLEKNDLDEIAKGDQRLAHRKAVRKEILNGADPMSAKIMTALTIPYPPK